MIPVIDMCSGTGELSAATQGTLLAPTGLASLSDSDSRAREYLAARWPGVALCDDCRDQDVPDGAIVTIGAPCQDLSYAGVRAGAAAGSGTRSALIHDCVAAAIAGHASLIVAENVPGGRAPYEGIAAQLRADKYKAAVVTGGAWEVGAPHRRQRIMLVATKHAWQLRPVNATRTAPPRQMLPTPTASSGTGPGRQGRAGGMNLQTWAATTDEPPLPLLYTWGQIIGSAPPPCRDDQGRLNARFVEWMMALPSASNLSRQSRIRLAGNAVVGRQASLMLARALVQLNSAI